jgi:succinoglycan biosynthesis transport protein ExoP
VPDGETATHALAIAEASQQLALAKSASNRRQAELERIRKEKSGETRPDHSGEIREIARQLEHESLIVHSQVQSMEQYLEALRGASSDSYRQKAELQALELRAASSAKLYDELKRNKQAAMQQRDAFHPEARIVAPALKPEFPSSPSPLLLIPAALIASLLFGAGMTLALDRLDTRFRNKRDVAEALGISCIGLVPEIRLRSKKISDYLLKNPSPVFLEAIQSLVVSVLRPISIPRAPKIVLLTSSAPKEGKSTLALSMGFCAARLRRRVLVISFVPPITHAPKGLHVPENEAKNLTPIGTSLGLRQQIAC